MERWTGKNIQCKKGITLRTTTIIDGKTNEHKQNIRKINKGTSLRPIIINIKNDDWLTFDSAAQVDYFLL